MSRVKTGVSLPKELLDLIDEYMRRTGVKSRSKILSEALQCYITEKIALDEKERVLGALIIVYNEKRGATVKRLLDAQHEYIGLIVATLHLHLSHDQCAEIIVVKGNKGEILNLLGELQNIIGVETARFIPIAPIMEDGHAHHHEH